KCSQLGGLAKGNEHVPSLLVEGHRKIASIAGRPGCYLRSRGAVNDRDCLIGWLVYKNPIADLIDLEAFRVRIELDVLSFDLAHGVERCKAPSPYPTTTCSPTGSIRTLSASAPSGRRAVCR